MNSTPRVETQEIADADLDNVSGGLLGGVGDTVGDVFGTVNGVVSVQGTVSTVTGALSPVVGLDTTGLAGVLGTV
jgi:hypothetical protein